MRKMQLDKNLRIKVYEDNVKTGYIESQSVRDNLIFKELGLLTEINENLVKIMKLLNPSGKVI